MMLIAIRIIIPHRRVVCGPCGPADEAFEPQGFRGEKAELAQTKLKEDFVYITADLNGLKGINDTSGKEKRRN